METPDLSLFEKHIAAFCGVPSATILECIQNVWSGFGQLWRVSLEGTNEQLVVKYICEPNAVNHPRGWNNGIATQRKLTSYAVERMWYQEINHSLPKLCVTPQFKGIIKLQDNIHLLLMEDLSSRQFYPELESTKEHIRGAINWLAAFHAFSLNKRFDNLWAQGNYWHLSTRPMEFESMPPSQLKHAAKAIDDTLQNATHTCLIHGDAKLANFCFNKHRQAAAVDFQYVGHGIGIQDLVYFLGSCLSEQSMAREYEFWVEFYFTQLAQDLHTSLFHDIETEWRKLLPFAWADFQRFIEGWSPGHRKDTSFSQQQTQIALDQL